MRVMRFLCLVIISPMSIFAKDFSIQGNIYQICEQSFLEMIDERLKKIDIPSAEQRIQEIAKAKIQTPTPIDYITRATETRSFQYDPTYILETDVILPSGEILHRAGTKVNPLDYIDWDGRLIFIDHRDKTQISWLKHYLVTDSSGEHKIILTGGNPLALEEELGRKIYFDQQAILTSKFRIQHVPAILVRDGKYLTVTEINP